MSSSLAKGFAHGPPSLHPWQIDLDFVIPADRHLAVFTSPIYKDDITFDQWALLTVSCLTHVANVNIFDCIHVIFQWSIVSGDLIGMLVAAAFNRNQERVDPSAKGEERAWAKPLASEDASMFTLIIL